MFKKSTITLLFLMIGTITAAQEGPKLKFDEPDDVFWDNRFGDYGADGFITDMEYVNADTIFLAGTFNTINGYHTPGIAMWNGSFWEAVPANNDQLGDVHVSQIEYINGVLYFLSSGRFANFNESTDQYLKAYDFNSGTFKVFDEGFYPVFSVLTANDSGILYLLSSQFSYNEDLGEVQSFNSVHFLNPDFDYISTTQISGFVQTQAAARLKAVHDGAIIYNLNAQSISTAFSTFNNPKILYVTDSYLSEVTDLGINGYSRVSDFDEIENGIMFVGTPDDPTCSDCAVRKFSFVDSTWSNGYYFDFGFLPPDRIAAKDEFNFSLGRFNLNVAFGSEYGVQQIKNGNPVSDFTPITNGVTSQANSIGSMIQVGDSTFLSFSFNRALSDLPVSDFGYIDDGIKQLGPNTTSLGVSDYVNTMIEVGDKLFVGGKFQSSGGQFISGLGVFQNDEWVNIGNFEGGFPFTSINTLMHFDKYVFVGGSFSEIQNDDEVFYANNLAIYDTVSGKWSSLGNTDGLTFNKLEKVGNTIYARVLNQTGFTHELYRYQNGEWSNQINFGNDYSITVNHLNDIVSINNTLYLAGSLTLNSFEDNSYTANYPVLAIDESGVFPINIPYDLVDGIFLGKFSIVDDEVLISGPKNYSNDGIGGIQANTVYKITGDTVQTFLPSPGTDAVHIIGSNDRLFAYSATESGAAGFNGISTWDGESWKILGSGVRDTGEERTQVNAAVVTNDGKLAVGGKFTFAGNKPASNFTFWSGETAPSTPITISFKNTPVIDYSESLTFLWTNANFSSEFEFELSDKEDFSNLIIGITGISENKVEVRTGFEPSVIYYWRVRAVNSNGASSWSDIGTFEMASPVSAEQNEAVVRFELMQNYPNPFNPSTNIQFSIPTSQLVTLEVFDVSGRKVATLLNDEHLSAGIHTRVFNADRLASGVYFYRIATDNQVLLKKMLLIK